MKKKARKVNSMKQYEADLKKRESRKVSFGEIKSLILQKKNEIAKAKYLLNDFDIVKPDSKIEDAYYVAVNILDQLPRMISDFLELPKKVKKVRRR